MRKELLFELLIYLLALFSIIHFFHNNSLLLITLFILWMIGVKFWHKKHDIIFFVAGAVVGSLSEIICIHFGAWQYANPSFLGIPVWLPFVWGLAMMIIKRFAETFVKIEMKR